MVYNEHGVNRMPPLPLWAVLIGVTLYASSCGGLSGGLPAPGAANPQTGSSIRPEQPIVIVFLNALDAATIPSNLSVTATGSPVAHNWELMEEGYRLVVRPLPRWPAGAALQVVLHGGQGRAAFADGRELRTITLRFWVEVL